MPKGMIMEPKVYYPGYAIYIRRCLVCDQKFVTDRPSVEKTCGEIECYLEYQKNPSPYREIYAYLENEPVPYEVKSIRPTGERFKEGEKWTRRIPPDVKRSVILRDKGKCRYCGEPAECIDHIIPFSKGGSSNTAANLVQACERCNVLVWDREFENFKEKRRWIRDKVFHKLAYHYILSVAEP
jgi:5-methylcytosine-specific restriction endonuclease McrA